jgi:hypothetical protein
MTFEYFVRRIKADLDRYFIGVTFPEYSFYCIETVKEHSFFSKPGLKFIPFLLNFRLTISIYAELK